MPTYEYACKDCGQHVEVVQSFRDAPLTTCALCGGTLRKVFAAAGIIFKGSGYYVTDSRAKPAKAGGDGKGDREGADKTAADGGTKTGEDKGASPAASAGDTAAGKGASAPKAAASKGAPKPKDSDAA